MGFAINDKDELPACTSLLGEYPALSHFCLIYIFPNLVQLAFAEIAEKGHLFQHISLL